MYILTHKPGQKEINNATKELRPLLKKSIHIAKGAKPKNWRVNPVNYTFPKDAQFEPGAVDFSPAWFPARHQVKCYLF
jgi:hypothetical protein